ncbi:MAG TPA: phosphatase [Fibrobacteraceae bacterium]|nr:phosphatase [Fibrobacter sp.]HPW94899.1 phosphatase [Fibrobacteraceae bacterium]HQB64625.1 phosphatase [Fibrobacteraceae bacterium]
MPNKLLASIDIGSHSCILLIAAFEKQENGQEKLVPKLQKVEVCRLGEDVYEFGAISEERLNDLIIILERFRSTVHALGVDLKAVAMTEAMRKASNSDEVILAVEKALWFKPQIISGEEEAALTYKAISEWYHSELLTLDIGGGSTELCLRNKCLSIPVGALYLFKKMGAIPGPEYKNFVKETFKEYPVRAFSKKEVVFIGGTATALAMVYLNLNQFKYEQIEGLEMTLNDLEQTTMRISNLSKELRALLPGLENGRSDVIICGLYWLKSLLERLHVESFKISTAGIRYGLLYPSPSEESHEIK